MEQSSDAPHGEGTDGLAAFLRARFDDDVSLSQQATDEVGQKGVYLTSAIYLHLARFDGPRVKREVEAKRRIIDRYEETERRAESCIVDGLSNEPDDEVAERLALEWVVRQLALSYSDHRDYREEWRP